MKATNAKPILEKIRPEFGSSFKVVRYDETNFFKKPYWHCHPGYEIIYISKGKGKRYIGNHSSEYDGGDLILLGPNLPHIGFGNSLQAGEIEISVQMEADFLGKEFFQLPEMESIRRLFNKAQGGLSFSGKTKEEVGQKLEKFEQLDYFHRLIELLVVLDMLAASKELMLLNAGGMSLEVNAQNLDRIQMIFEYISHNYRENILLQDAAEVVNMTVPAFCRFLKKKVNKTFTQIVNEFRIAQACKMLSEEHYTIAMVSFECGFNNLSHFNKLFKSATGSSPSNYRKNKNMVVK